MTMPRRLEATATRDGRWWLVQIPELDTVGQARNVAQIHAAATEVAALYLDVPVENVDVHVTVLVNEEARQLWEEAERAEAQARSAQQRSAQLRREAVRRARADQYTLDATAAAFGVSRARVQQLEKATERRPQTIASRSAGRDTTNE